MVVLIATTGRSDLLRNTLASINACEFPTRYRETLVVENGPKGQAESIVADFRLSRLRARYLYSNLANKSRALNLAMENMDGSELVIFTDDDARVRPNWLKAYADASDGEQQGIMYGGPLAVDYEIRPKPWLIKYMPWSAKGRTANDISVSRKRPVVLNGINWAAYAKDLLAVGGSDESLGPGTMAIGQEGDWQRRLWRYGVRQQVVPEALVWHFVPQHRCTPGWVLRRLFRKGVAIGARIRQRHQGNSLPAAAIKATLCKLTGIRYGFRRMLFERDSEARAFNPYVKSYFQRGMLAGLQGKSIALPVIPALYSESNQTPS